MLRDFWVKFFGVAQTEEHRCTPDSVVESVMGRGIKWYDWGGLSYADRVVYWNDVQAVVASAALKNEIKHYLSDLIEEIATKSRSQEYTEKLRYSFNGVQCLMERLEGIPDPKKESSEPDQNPNEI